MRPLLTMRAALSDPHVFGATLDGDSWSSWRVLLIAAMGEPLTADERRTFERLTARPHEPGERVDELWCIIGRRGGKTRGAAVLAAYLAALVDWSPILAPGERASLPIMSASLWQARKARQYLDGIFASGSRRMACNMCRPKNRSPTFTGISCLCSMEAASGFWIMASWRVN